MRTFGCEKRSYSEKSVVQKLIRNQEKCLYVDNQRRANHFQARNARQQYLYEYNACGGLVIAFIDITLSEYNKRGKNCISPLILH